ncbi:MAG: VanR-ABDEGLN family response regulator transcription factor [Longicatena sp.]|nr:VanR-ABDEGLN family response regulator transcription factor [Longicatena sp.]
MSEKILVLDDEKEIADLVTLYLKNENYDVYTFYDSKAAIAFLNEHKVDLAILDVMLPDVNGFEICAMIREKYNYPIMMLTAKIEDHDKIEGLSLGADDYITKPFNPLEVSARVKAQLRRYKKYNHQKEDANIIDFRGLIIDNDSHRCSLYDEELALTPLEFNILWYLCLNRGRVVSFQELFEAVWKEKYFDSNNTVMVHIRRLREKMKEPPKRPKFIQSVWGIGYKIEE